MFGESTTIDVAEYLFAMDETEISVSVTSGCPALSVKFSPVVALSGTTVRTDGTGNLSNQIFFCMVLLFFPR